jgi:DNA topoisomerase-1
MSTKKYATIIPTLVIVESPAKCAKIESYLGTGYKCLASFGHLTQLKSLDAINTDANFKTKYEIVDDPKKKKHIDFLRREIEKSKGDVILATDDDREGEAIAWHICSLFDLPINSTKRIVFHEITETAIQNAVRNPRTIDMNLVQSQQTRQILDLLVGFKVSPMLWKYVSTNKVGLSAGRCQTPALKLIYDNQREINQNPGKKVYNTVIYFMNHNLPPFDLNKEYNDEDEISNFLEASASHEHTFSRTEPKKVFKEQPQPLTTSRIQQIASNEMHISPKETMKICQTLYEAGLITYMRTDSKKYSEEFVELMKMYILDNYQDKRYIFADIDSLKNNSKRETEEEVEENPKKKSNSKKISVVKKEADKPKPQEAHEAIRPTHIETREIPEYEKMSPKERRMYKLIWETTVESCMSPAEYVSITANVSAPENAKYSYTSELLSFLGWKAVSNDKKIEKEEKENKYYHYLYHSQEGRVFDYRKITSKLTLKNLKQHYTEAKLVQLLEDNGIGRPSTFSMLVDKIQEKEYVKKQDIQGIRLVCKDFELENDTITETETAREFGNEKGKLVIQPMGVVVIEFLEKHFNELFNYNYTSEMETTLDKISKGEEVWYETCGKCLQQIKDLIDRLQQQNCEETEGGVGISKYEVKIDEYHSYIIGKHGPVIKCALNSKKITFIPVKPNINISILEKGGYKLEDIADAETKSESKDSLGKYEGYDLILKKGKYGLYVEWGEKSKSLKCFGNRPKENITYEDVVKILDEIPKDGDTSGGQSTANIVRNISENISIRRGKFGDYIFYKTDKMTKPEFFKLKGFPNDYKSCDKGELTSWINDTFHIY